ncbi:MAG: hypothetical protein RIS92_347 [Verrucomicrobiota bacterium]
MDHVVDAVPCLLNAREIRETEGAMVVVEFEGRDAGRVRLKSEHHYVHHEAHVFRNVLRNSVSGSGAVRFFEGGPPAL